MTTFTTLRDLGIIGLFLLTTACALAKPPGVEGKIVSHGIYVFSDNALTVKTPETTSGITRVPESKPVLVTETNRVAAKIGTRFGIVYYIVHLPVNDGYVDITKVVTHPAIKKPDGSTMTGFTTTEKQFVKDGQLVGWTGYGFDHDYELAPGQWTFAIMFEGQPLCKQEFTVFKE
jgi:hypothetical protein